MGRGSTPSVLFMIQGYLLRMRLCLRMRSKFSSLVQLLLSSQAPSKVSGPSSTSQKRILCSYQPPHTSLDTPFSLTSLDFSTCCFICLKWPHLTAHIKSRFILESSSNRAITPSPNCQAELSTLPLSSWDLFSISFIVLTLSYWNNLCVSHLLSAISISRLGITFAFLYPQHQVYGAEAHT